MNSFYFSLLKFLVTTGCHCNRRNRLKSRCFICAIIIVPRWAIWGKSLNNNRQNLFFWACKTEHPQQTIVLRKTAGQQPGSGHLSFKVFPFGAIELIISKPGINDKFKTAYEILMTVVNLLIGFELKFTCDNLKNAPLDTSRIESVSKNLLHL